MIRVILTTRATHWAALATALLTGLSALVGTTVIRIDLAPATPNRIPLCELAAIVTATVLAVITRPRLWEWERLAHGHRARIVATSTAAAGIALPALCVLAIVPGLPDGTPWLWVLANALAMAALVHLASPLTGPLPAGLITLVIWLAAGTLHNLTPQASPYLPTARYVDAQPHWTFTTALVAAALVVHLHTHGSTPRQHDRHQD